MGKEVALYATIYSKSLEKIEEIFKKIFCLQNFKKVEQGTVLLYEDDTISLSFEYHNESFYLSGRYMNDLNDGVPCIRQIASCLKENRISFSIDYQEEDDGIPTSEEFNISYPNKETLL
jgi:hypothetical protein